MFESKAKVESLMNLVMQFRKVCNHPELFERRPCRSPFFFQQSYYYTGNLPVYFGHIKEIFCNANNPIEFHYPKLMHDELSPNFFQKKQLISKKFLIWNAHYLHQQLFRNSSSLNFFRLLNLSPGLLESLFETDEFFTAVLLIHFHITLNRKYRLYSTMSTRNLLWVNEDLLLFPDYYDNKPLLHESKSLLQIKSYWIAYNLNHICVHLPKVLSPPVQFLCSSYHFTAEKTLEATNRLAKYFLFGETYSFSKRPIEKSVKMPYSNQTYLRYPYQQIFPYPEQVLYPSNLFESFSKIEIPDFRSLVADSAKLNYLDKMLYKLKKNNHRVLIFCQMTKMMDILEDYLMRKKYQFFRLDGSCNIADRRDMVDEFQSNPNIFAFLLSTRAGGLGVTLTAADTVIFYDNDWNPTMDAQATDRAHRIGQTKEVELFFY